MLTRHGRSYQRARIKRYLHSGGKLCSQQRTNRAERLAGGCRQRERDKGDVTSSSLLWFDVIYSVCKTKHRLAHTLDKKKDFTLNQARVQEGSFHFIFVYVVIKGQC